MAANLARILKSADVNISGTVKLELETNFDSIGQADTHQARVISCDGEYALIEVNCNCGQKFYLKCNYSDMAQNAG